MSSYRSVLKFVNEDFDESVKNVYILITQVQEYEYSLDKSSVPEGKEANEILVQQTKDKIKFIKNILINDTINFPKFFNMKSDETKKFVESQFDNMISELFELYNLCLKVTEEHMERYDPQVIADRIKKHAEKRTGIKL
jgi:hypothetical protein